MASLVGWDRVVNAKVCLGIGLPRKKLTVLDTVMTEIRTARRGGRVFSTLAFV